MSYEVRKARTTKTRVALASPGEVSCTEEGWQTICEDHGGVMGHETRKLAVSWWSHPEDWCPTCQGHEKLTA